MPSEPTLSRRSLLRSAAALTLFGWQGMRSSWAFASQLRLGEPAPAATLVSFDGRRIATADLRGQVVILTFWATWCVPCREELPLLSAYAQRHAAEGLSVLGFSLDTPDHRAQALRVAQSLSFPTGLLADSSAPGYGRIWRLPVNFTMDRRGLLVDDGWKDKQAAWTQQRLERVVTPLLSAPP